MRLPTFERSARRLLSDGAERWLDNTLSQEPEAGPVIPGTGGVRKIRVALPGRGKSGGARVIYFYQGGRSRVFLILAYPKGAKANLTGDEKRQMRKLATLLRTEQ